MAMWALCRLLGGCLQSYSVAPGLLRWLPSSAIYLALSAFDGLHVLLTCAFECDCNGSWVSQLVSYCITFSSEPDTQEQLSDIHAF